MNDTGISNTLKKDMLWWVIVVIGFATAWSSYFVHDDLFLTFKLVVLGALIVLASAMVIAVRIHGRRLDALEERIRKVEIGDIGWK